MSINMGIGQLGSPNLVIKRKFRWTLEIQDQFTGGVIVPAAFVKMAARPNLSIEETETNYLNTKSWIPGKCSWEEMTVTYFDTDSNEMKPLWEYLAPQYQAQPPQYHKAGYILKLYDGCGYCMEEWRLHDGMVTAINFGELDHSSSELVTVEMTVRYSKVEYKSHCPSYPGFADPPYGGIMATKEPDWTMPEDWIIKTPVTESSSPGERVLDQFLRRMASK